MQCSIVLGLFVATACLGKLVASFQSHTLGVLNHAPVIQLGYYSGIGSPCFALNMGGYYVEADEEASKNIIDRSQTHMIFGVRCLEAKVSCALDDKNNDAAVLGLIPIAESSTDETSDRISSSILPIDDSRKSCSEIVFGLLEESFANADSKDPLIKRTRTLIEIGSDPIFSLLVSVWMGNESRKLAGKYNHKILIEDSDEKRLQVLEHAHQFFNSKVPSVSLSTKLLPRSHVEIPHDDDQDKMDQDHDRIVVLTTTKDLVDRLNQLILGPGDSSDRPSSTKYRIFVPCTFLTDDRLSASFDFKHLGTDGQLETDGFEFLEVIGVENRQKA